MQLFDDSCGGLEENVYFCVQIAKCMTELSKKYRLNSRVGWDAAEVITLFSNINDYAITNYSARYHHEASDGDALRN